MKQYFGVKKKYPDAILLFRVGDFYETFGEDAIKAANILGIVLTKRNNGGSDIELAGFPYHSMDLYLPRLVKAGYRVAICEQLEKPSKEKKIVKRGVTEVVTPGLATSEQLLDHRSNNFLAALHFDKKDYGGIALLDVSTGEFLVSEGTLDYVEKLVQGFQPSELLYCKSKSKIFSESFGDSYYSFKIDEWVYTQDYTREKLLDHFGVKSLKGFGIEEMTAAQIAAGTILHYLSTTENKNIKHINNIARIEPDNYVWLDRFTIRNLELLHSNHESGISLFQVLDHTISPMGARLLRKWVVLPLKSLEAIKARHRIVTYFIKNPHISDELENHIRQIGDLERLISKVPLGKINPREVVQLKKSLIALVPIKENLLLSSSDPLKTLGDSLHLCTVIKDQIAKSLVDDPPAALSKGNVIAEGFHEELDELRSLINNSKEKLEAIRLREAEKTGITSLKIGFNNVFGYYLEVTNKYKGQGLVPDNWVRKQTLTNSERYISEELKILETKILGAEDNITTLEAKLFDTLVAELMDYIQPIQHNAHIIARLDCLLAFAKIALKYNYCEPNMNEGLAIDIKNGRHPVIEQQLKVGEEYVPNDTFLDNDQQQLMMITGPNMSGKSALLRQTALICLMAQMGGFVPASDAQLGIVDKIFTRVGASDNISSGESTFMVEMNETASIMNNISDRSLILLDEIGRGTSTYDGISIAWAIAEYLHNNGIARPKTLFATHYHELNELANSFDRIQNYRISTKEIGQKVIFLRKLIKGGSNHSFGIYVAKMAGMPKSIISRASEILGRLESKSIEEDADKASPSVKQKLNQLPQSNYQLSIFETVDPQAGKLKQTIQDLNINAMTPIECMMKLNELLKIVNEGES